MTSTAQPTAAADLTQALVILDPDRTDLLRELDRIFAGWGASAGAREILPPPLYPVSDLEKFDVYDNFPHLALAAAPLDLQTGEGRPEQGRFAPGDLLPARLGLPHATCYGAYLYYEGTHVADDTLVTLVNRCFRNETHYSGLRRLLTFQMREIVALGAYEHTQRVIADFTARITAFAEALALPLAKEAATDPFFSNDGARALLARLSPVKYEFQLDGLAIASVNTHRNFFGERCAIKRAGTDSYAYTGCVAFGLERWLSVLLDAHGGDAPAALEAVRAADRKTSAR
ncbi:MULTISPECIES: class-II aminoacyl-tRNA synthetase family protein [Streptomycetaceae]|uniref:Seryl-tRNA synthetase n=1 Tax=Streptantibioticus cattleyicolor (strain ATCC 35852 / DSM 46488 / JCM 4925 / NBRC 14057 / NRRL 8057) TaxID=1003195 RepID=F8JRD8_STREN|nr:MULTISPECIES: hypothetical protein [Streptomycetaceae]AEW96638.1 hypothetical protein SCATT_42670 [Streptantibioticus cattleyicolor NRRL 8057 = DSM 46488]MYS61131.1 hypothetical protein [Streptomyces sp. SID5468]CCB76976.1 tRNA synthetase class II [Streptantibioticus cattleyicolor NRRL 8057 = DSM 46488]